MIVDEFEANAASTFELYFHADFPFEDQGQNTYKVEGTSGSLSMKLLKPDDVAHQAFSQQFAGQPFRAQPAEPEPELPALELDDAHMYDLYEAYERIIASIDFNRFGDHRVQIDDTPAAVYQENLLQRLRRAGGRLALQEAFEGHERVQRLGLFLAMLELVRLRRIVVRQEDLLSDIAVELT